MLFSDKNIPQTTVDTVNRLSQMNRIPQCVLLTGGSAALRRKCALELSKAVVCSKPQNGSPCLKCPECIRAKAGTHPDIMVIEPEKDKKTVSVKQIRQSLFDTIYIAPHEALNKVYIIPEAQELSPVIQNTLLKSIEEPPPFVMFILEATQREQLLSTVISRCTELSLGQTGNKKIDTQDALAGEIAENLANALFREGEWAIMEALAPAAKNRSLTKKVAATLQLIVRDALVESSGASPLTQYERQSIGLSGRFSVDKLLNIYRICDEYQSYADSNANENLLISGFTAALAQIIR